MCSKVDPSVDQEVHLVLGSDEEDDGMENKECQGMQSLGSRCPDLMRSERR